MGKNKYMTDKLRTRDLWVLISCEIVILWILAFVSGYNWGQMIEHKRDFVIYECRPILQCREGVFLNGK